MMQLKKLRRLLMTAAFCVMTNTVSLAGNDSVAIVYLTSFQQNQQQIEATIYQSQTYPAYTLVIPHHTFMVLATNHSELYIRSGPVTGWIRNLHLIGNVIHGKTERNEHVAITVSSH